MGTNRSGGHTGGGSNKYCSCGHPKAEHKKRKGECKMCDCEIYNRVYQR